MRFERIKDEWAFFDTELDIRAAWYTLPCLEWIVSQDWVSKTIFEYGAGASTLWWRKLGALVKGVDNNQYYINTGIKFQPVPDLFPYEIKGNYDVIVIDGIQRRLCFIEALNHLNKNGIIIVDNWEQFEFEIMPLENINIIHLFKQDGHQDWATAICGKK